MCFSMMTVVLTPWLINFRSNLPRLCRCPPGRCTCRKARPVSSLSQLAFLKATLLRVGQIQEDSEDEEFNDSMQDNYVSLGMSKSVVSQNCGDPAEKNEGRGKKNGLLSLQTIPSEIQAEIHPTSVLDNMQKKMTLGLWSKRIFIFYYSPAIKFVSHTVWYIVYLLLYAFVLLYALDPPVEGEFPAKIHWTEYLLYFWQFTFMVEELRIILWYPGDKFKDKIYDWWHFSSLATWNHFDLLTLGFSIIIFLLRWIPQLFPLTRLLLVLNLIAYIMRIFKMYFINDYLGPKVVMIKRMSKDLAMFFLVLIVFMASYSVGYQALYYGSRKFQFDGLGNSFRYGIWEIFGEFAEPSAIDDCNKTLLNITIGDLSYSVTDCNLRRLPVQILLAAYLFFVNILLVNMLIATFAHVFEEIQANSEEVWKFEMYFLLEEFRSKPLLPSPFIILEHAFLILRMLSNWKSSRINKTSRAVIDEELIWGQRLNQEELHFLGVFECVCRADFIENESKNVNTHCSCICTCSGCKLVRGGVIAPLGGPRTHAKSLTMDHATSRDIMGPSVYQENQRDMANLTMLRRKRFAAIKKQ